MQDEQVIEQTSQHNHGLIWVLVSILAIGLVGLGYYTYQLQNENTALQQENTRLKAQEVVESKTTSTTTADFMKPEDVIKVYVGQADNIKLTRTEGDFAEYSYSYGSGTPGGAMIVIKKSGDYWLPVFNGQESPSKVIGEQFGMPKGWYATDY